MFRKIISDADKQHLQYDINKLTEWYEKWQMLNTTLKEKDLWLTISADMKVSEQYGIAAAKGNQILGLIR